MKNFSKVALLCICLLITAMFTTACGGGGKTTPPSYPYFPINNQANNNQNNGNNNNQQENNNNQENNNEEAPVASTDITLKLTDSLQSDKIATADIFYAVEDNTKKSSAEDQEILKAEPNADDNTKFTVKVPDGIDFANVKIKAILTYDSEGNLLDYFSSYNGIEATNGTFDVDFENSKDNEEGFGGGTGTDKDPFIISAPRHFANINKTDDNGDYLYLDKYFIQTSDIDFSHLTGLKINATQENKKLADVAIDVKNEKAPFYNNGKGILPIGADVTETYVKSFQGNYDGDDYIIDGIIIVNPMNDYSGLFPLAENATIQNLTIGENSIFFIDKLTEFYSVGVIQIGAISGCLRNSTIDKCQNNSEILITNLDANYGYCLLNIHGIALSNDDNSTIKNCKNTGNITISNCKIETTGAMTGIRIASNYDNTNNTNNTNEGNINITNNQFIGIGNGILTIENRENNYTNAGHTTIDNNTNLVYIDISINEIYEDAGMNDCINDGHITITNNQLDSGIDGSINVIDFYAYSFSNCINNGNILINGNSENYFIGGAMNILGGDGATNNGKVTVNGVEGPINNQE